MGFNDVRSANGPYFLNPGMSMEIGLIWGSGDDMGAQWIMAHPLNNGQPSSKLVVHHHGKVLDYSVASVTVNGAPEYGYDPASSYYWYRVIVTNEGNFGTSFSVQGGGNT